jgi:predicted aconitase
VRTAKNIESDRNFGKLVQVLNKVAEVYGLPVIVSTHPRTQKRVEAMGAAVSSSGAIAQAVGIYRLQQAAVVCAGGAFRQRNHQ